MNSIMSELVAETVAVPLVEGVDKEISIDERIDQQITKMMGSVRGNVNNMITVQEVKLYPNHVEVEVKGIKKAISWIDFKQMIDSQLQLETKLQTQALPYNTYVMAKSGSELHISCYYPERRMDLKHIDRDVKPKLYKNCLLPNMVISHKLKLEDGHWKVADSRYFATNKKVTELPEDRILWAPEAYGWRVPFPNFYNDYRMCYGGNTMPVRFTDNIRGLDYYYQIISVSPFNNDLGINVDSTIPAWFQTLTEVDKFPYELLLTSRY